VVLVFACAHSQFSPSTKMSSLCQSGKSYIKVSPNEALSGVQSQNKQHYVGQLD